MLSIYPHLWLAALVVMTPLSPASAGGVAQIFMDPYGHFYRITGFGLETPSDYTISIVNSICTCRRLCQVTDQCHSVTAVPITEGEVECRTSISPQDISDPSQRPDLTPIPGAVHFLETTSSLWEVPLEDGLFYRLASNTARSNSNRCTGGYDLAICRSPEQFEVFKRFIDESGTTGMYVHLAYEQDWQELRWADAKTYDEAALDTSMIGAYDASAETVYFKAVLINGEYKFLPTPGDDQIFLLCQANDLRIFW